LQLVLRGYLDRVSAGAGSSVRVRLSAGGEPSAVSVVKLSHSDPNPAGPGFVTEACPWPATPLRPVTEQATVVGSYAVVDNAFSECDDAFALLAWVLPTRLEGENVIFSWLTDSGPAQLAFRGRRLVLGPPRTAGLLEAPHEIHERQWLFVGVGVGRQVSIAWGVLGRTGGPYQLVGPAHQALMPKPGSPLLLGASPERPDRQGGGLDAKIARPLLLDRCPDAVALMDIMNFGPDRAGEDGHVLASWGFGVLDDPERVIDLSGHGRHGSLVNAPSLGVLGPPDNGGARAEQVPLGPPFDTVHLHSDDLEDSKWPDTHVLDVPADAQSGVYALRVTRGDDEVDLAFVVRPRHQVPVLLLVPTYTWQAYANLGRDPAQYPGLSHYAVHRDGSPVYITTRLKPAPATGPRARVEVDGVDSFISADEAAATADASHLLMADLYANWWLERTGVEFGAVTDEDLHHEGTAVLDGCRALVLSAHPEYWTEKMLQSLSDFLGRGGSVIYLGGNGLYWVTSVHPSRPHLLEVRRRAGSQTSAAPAGEDAHVFEAQPGGTWPGRGRPPDHLVGVGFAGFGWDRAVGYRRTEASYGEHFGWVFAGVEAPVVGTEGLNMGGAVAFEFDRYDPGLAPPGTQVLATAQPAGGGFFRAYEDGPGRAPDELVRCDMTILETDQGGIVFSLGSIAASGCLPELNGHTTDLARVCTNVLRRALA